MLPSTMARHWNRRWLTTVMVCNIRFAHWRCKIVFCAVVLPISSANNILAACVLLVLTRNGRSISARYFSLAKPTLALLDEMDQRIDGKVIDRRSAQLNDDENWTDGAFIMTTTTTNTSIETANTAKPVSLIPEQLMDVLKFLADKGSIRQLDYQFAPFYCSVSHELLSRDRLSAGGSEPWISKGHICTQLIQHTIGPAQNGRYSPVTWVVRWNGAAIESKAIRYWLGDCFAII